MKKFAITLCALMLGTVTAASAADLPVRTYSKAPSLPVVAAYDWSGFYIGVNGGGGGGQNCFHYIRVDGGCHNPHGGLAGGQVGYNWQLSNVVLGLEFSGDWADLTGSHVRPFGPWGTMHSHVSGIYMGTARAGYAWDRTLLYIKGGVAWVDADYHLTCNGVVGGGICLPVGATAERSSVTRIGGVVGAGLEYAVSKNLILGVEGDYLPLGTRTETFDEPPGYACGAGVGQPCPIAVKQNLWTVAGRLSWKF
jgi:outer membrane immunogenic protein